jgi:DNA-directed RNA polymerase subunit beta'
MSFDLVNTNMTKKAISKLLNTCYREVGHKATVVFADQIMYTGFSYASRSGCSIGIDDMVIPDRKKSIVDDADSQVKEIEEQYISGLVSVITKWSIFGRVLTNVLPKR